jgi:hypothetical protein
MGHVAVGAIAAVVVWGIYGAAARLDLGTPEAKTSFSLPIAQLSFSLLVGIGGAEILKRLSEKQADEVSKANLADALNSLMPALQNPPSPPPRSPTGKA